MPLTYILRRWTGVTNLQNQKKNVTTLFLLMALSVLQKMKQNRDSVTNNKIIQPWYGNGILHRIWAVLIMRKDRGRNSTAELRINQYTWRKRKLEVLGNSGNRHHQTRGIESFKKSTSDEREPFSNQTLQQISYQRDKHLGSHSSKILETFLNRQRKKSYK